MCSSSRVFGAPGGVCRILKRGVKFGIPHRMINYEWGKAIGAGVGLVSIYIYNNSYIP